MIATFWSALFSRHCIHCGKTISAEEKHRNGGLCDDCQHEVTTRLYPALLTLLNNEIKAGNTIRHIDFWHCDNSLHLVIFLRYPFKSERHIIQGATHTQNAGLFRHNRILFETESYEKKDQLATREANGEYSTDHRYSCIKYPYLKKTAMNSAGYDLGLLFISMPLAFWISILIIPLSPFTIIFIIPLTVLLGFKLSGWIDALTQSLQAVIQRLAHDKKS